jgi:2-keto-myo-inositol isomerase
MTVPSASTRQLIDVAAGLGCVGVELRNDLGKPLFDGVEAAEIRALTAAQGQRILALAEMKAFNENRDDKRETAQTLIATARDCGAEGVALIPAVAQQSVDRTDQRNALRKALIILQPILENYGVKGLIEPLGFTNSSLRFKDDVVASLDELSRPDCFAIVHDTFHHHLAGGGHVYADLTAIVHISGVVDPALAVDQMTDAHRVLVDAHDRLDNIGQLRSLRAAGYTGPASFEAFAPEIHDMKDPTAALAGSIAFINTELAAQMAGAA